MLIDRCTHDLTLEEVLMEEIWTHPVETQSPQVSIRTMIGNNTDQASERYPMAYILCKSGAN